MTTAPFKKYLITGLFIWLPISVTYLICHFIFSFIGSTLLTIPAHFRPEYWLGIKIPLLEWILTITVILLTGVTVSYYVGYKLEKIWDALVRRLPLLGTIHHACKRFVHIILNTELDNVIGKVVLVEYPREGMWRIGFQMSKPYTWALPGREMITVIFPSCPEPTSGYIALVPVEQVIDLKVGLAEGLKTTFSFGIIQPVAARCDEKLTPQETQK